MRMILWAVLAATLAGPVRAQLCDELWLARNMVFDRAGHCFASPLGRALFGAEGCTTTSPALDARAAAVVAEVREVERNYGCDVDTGRATLDIPHLATRLALIDPPVPDGLESACIGWLGPPIVLRAGLSDDAPQTGVILTGETLLFLYSGREGWWFLPSPTDDARMGWVRALAPEGDIAAMCDAVAG